MIYSYSHFSTFQTCPFKYRETYINKTAKDDTTNLHEGNRLHTLLEKRIMQGEPLPSELANCEPVCSSLNKPGLKRSAEMALGVTRDGLPADFWGKSELSPATPVFRGKVDVIAYRPDAGVGLNLDWKTGKPQDNYEQHAGYALLVFAHYPRIDKLRSSNVYTKTGELGTPYTFDRKEYGALLARTIKLCEPLDKAAEIANYPKTPGPLCGWCGVLHCENNPKAVR